MVKSVVVRDHTAEIINCNISNLYDLANRRIIKEIVPSSDFFFFCCKIQKYLVQFQVWNHVEFEDQQRAFPNKQRLRESIFQLCLN